jgi:hypothetical protein
MLLNMVFSKELMQILCRSWLILMQSLSAHAYLQPLLNTCSLVITLQDVRWTTCLQNYFKVQQSFGNTVLIFEFTCQSVKRSAHIANMVTFIPYNNYSHS